MRAYGAGWRIMGLVCILAAGGAGCGGNRKNQEPIAAEEGGMGSYQEVLECSFGRRTLANPKFPDGDTYETMPIPGMYWKS